MQYSIIGLILSWLKLSKYHFSADHVLLWIKKENLLKDVTTPDVKFIPVGVPNHIYRHVRWSLS